MKKENTYSSCKRCRCPLSVWKQILFSLLLMISFGSCSSSLSDEGWPDSRLGSEYFGSLSYGDLYLAPKGPDDKLFYLPITDVDYDYAEEIMNRHNDSLRKRILRYKMLAYPSKREKYERLLKEEEQRLARRDKMIADAGMDLLRNFYADLYQKTQKDFTKLYKRRCSTDMLQLLKYVYIKRHNLKGYAWAIFGDNAVHKNADGFDYAYKGEGWYEVKIDTTKILVRVTGREKKRMQICGLANPVLRIGMLE
mgnify:CR=1 FL=1